MINSTLMTIQVLVNSEQLAEIEQYRMMLIKERPGLCWEPMLESEDETEEERRR